MNSLYYWTLMIINSMLLSSALLNFFPESIFSFGLAVLYSATNTFFFSIGLVSFLSMKPKE